MATIEGKLFANTDLTNNDLETITIPLLIRATIEPEDIYNYVDHSQAGRVINLSYENATFTTTSTTNGDYSIKVASSFLFAHFTGGFHVQENTLCLKLFLI